MQDDRSSSVDFWDRHIFAKLMLTGRNFSLDNLVWLVLLAYAIIAQPTPPRFGAQNTRCGDVAKNFSLDNCSSSGENNSSPHRFSPGTQNCGQIVRQWKSRYFFWGESRLRVGRNAWEQLSLSTDQSTPRTGAGAPTNQNARRSYVRTARKLI